MNLMKWSIIPAVVGFILAGTSILPIWPGPLLVRHLPPAVLSAVVTLFACLRARSEKSRLAGGITLAYGLLACVVGVGFLFIVSTATSWEALAAVGSYFVGGSVFAIVIGIAIAFLSWKILRK